MGALLEDDLPGVAAAVVLGLESLKGEPEGWLELVGEGVAERFCRGSGSLVELGGSGETASETRVELDSQPAGVVAA